MIVYRAARLSLTLLGSRRASASERGASCRVLNDSGLYFYDAAATFSSGRTAVSTQLHSEYSTIEGQTK